MVENFNAFEITDIDTCIEWNVLIFDVNERQWDNY